MTARWLALGWILLMLVGVRGYSQEPAPQPTMFLVLARATDSNADPGIRKLLTEYMQFELERARLRVAAPSDLPDALQAGAAIREDGSPADAAVALGVAAGADFVLVCDYGQDGNPIDMAFSCYDVGQSQLVASAERKVTQALRMEWSIAEVVSLFLSDTRDRLVFATDAPAVVEQPVGVGADASTADAPEGQESPETAVGEQPGIAGGSDRHEEPPEVDDRESAASAGSGRPEPVPQSAPIVETLPPQAPEPYLDDTSRRFEILAGVAPFVIVGKTSEYARLGMQTTVDVAYRFPGPQAQLILALSSGVCTFYAESAASGSRVVLVPIGFRLALRATPARLGFLVHAAGGAAALSVDPDQSGFRTKVVPYAGGGLGVEIPLLRRLALQVDLAFSAYFEGVYAVMGYSPSVNLLYRF